MSDLGFDPAKVSYSYRYTKNSRRRVDGSRMKAKSKGPYWYAMWTENGSLKAKYLGKTLPEECKPYAPFEVPLELSGENERAGRPFVLTNYGASDTILDALDKGEQVVIDIASIANFCKAYYNKIGNDKYVIYRDPK